MMVRPRKYKRRPVTLNLDDEIVEKLQGMRGDGSISDLVNQVLHFAMEGSGVYIKVARENEQLKAENANLREEVEFLRSRLEKVTEELAELKAKWGNQMQISEVSKDALLAERIAMLAREGVLVGDVLEELGIVGLREQLKVIKRIFRERDADTWESYYGPLRGWVIRRTGDGPLTEFVFQEQREVEVVGVRA